VCQSTPRQPGDQLPSFSEVSLPGSLWCF
jgi:hypothetical protein